MEHDTNNGRRPSLLGDTFEERDTSRAQRRAAQERETLWATLGTLWRHRLLIALVTGVAAVAAVVLSLLMPNWYRAEARLLLPSASGTGILAGALNDLPAAAKSLLGGKSGDYARYLTILSSEGVLNAAVAEFDLMQVYETADGEAPLLKARQTLADNTELLVDDEYEFLTVAVMDQDPERAAALTNFLVDEMTRRNALLASQSAAKFRRYIEDRYVETEAALDSVMTEQQRVQEQYGVLDLVAQGEIFYQSVADLRLQIFQAEAEYQQLLSALGPDNSLVRQARQGLASVQRQYEGALEGSERLLPVPQDSLPAITAQFFELQKEQLILAKLIEYIRPVLEEARFDEQRQIEAVQVVDMATAPERKFKPRRSIICIVVTLSAFLLVVLFVLVRDWWRRNHRYYVARLQAAARQPQAETPAPAPREPSNV